LPRAHRIHLPGQVWHLTHRCHHRRFLLRFARDRRLWRSWLYEARRRFGLCIFDYTVTSNHVHLIVRDRDEGEIAGSLQLIEGCTGQAYNRRKRRGGAFWEDQYHATAVETGEHLARCVVYVDLNMVRAGVVGHPAEWEVGGYHEIQRQSTRYRIVDRAALAEALGLKLADLACVHRDWIESALRKGKVEREGRWSNSVAVGSRGYVEQIRRELGSRGRYRVIEQVADSHILRETPEGYGYDSRCELPTLSRESAPP
jgi:putative transposase